MKHLLLTCCIFAAAHLQAQPFLSIAGTTKGAGFSVGYLESETGIEFSAGYNVPLMRADIPKLLHLSLGKRILLSHNEKDNFSITPSIGYADYSVKDFRDYNNPESGKIETIKKIKPIYALELGKDWYLGRLYVTANYCGNAYFGIGMRGFIKQTVQKVFN